MTDYLTEEQALELARKRFGSEAETIDRGFGTAAIPRYCVFAEEGVYGNGTTWAEALENATRIWER